MTATPSGGEPGDVAVVTRLRTEHSRSGVSPVPRPRLSWQVVTARRDWVQEAAELRLRRTSGASGESVVRLEGRECVFVDWPFEPLEAGEQAELSVLVTGGDGRVSAWSEPLGVTATFLAPGQWRAALVGLDDPQLRARPALVRSVFTVDGAVRRATLHSTGLGAYQVVVNGADVDEDLFKPGWTAYQSRLVHESTDVTDLLRPGRNAVGARLAGAWYTEQFCWPGNFHPLYGDQPAVAVQLEIEYSDGRSATVTTDAGWRATAYAALRSSGLYDGEEYDARLALADWSTATFDDTGWSSVDVIDSSVVPEARVAPPVRRTQELAVRKVLRTPSGRVVLDFGQNLTGRVRLTVSGEAGQTITLRHAEVLENDEICVRTLRDAKATDTYILAGRDREVWEPEFTFHGFRYVEVNGWPGDPDPTSFVAVVVHSDMERTGWFDSSHLLLNQLHDNVVWGMRGNFLAVPTDCPQRNERLGWTGDIQVFAPTASFLFDCDAFIDSWLRDLSIEQERNDGVVPNVIPNTFGPQPKPVAAWGDAATIVPWVLADRFADRAVLARQYDSMRDWADAVVRASGKGLVWEGDFQFGDWLDPDAPAERPELAKASADIVAGAYLIRTLDLVARAADVVGESADAGRYRDGAAAARAAFSHTYLSPAGRLMSDAPTAYALAICFDLVTGEGRRAALGDRLATLVGRQNHRIGTGFVGTPIILDALTMTGHLDVATALLLETECPSWLYPVTMGATTVWERWDSMRPDGTVNPGTMTSFNHYAFGAVADWLHRTVAGLAPQAAGYREIRIEPRPIAGLEFASARLETPYGRAESGWRREDGMLTVRAVVPPNTDASVRLPGAEADLCVGSGSHRWTIPDLQEG